MNPPNILTFALQVTKIFEQSGIPYYLGGSIASSLFGIPRTTLDIDIVVDIRQHHIPLLIKSFSEKEYYLDSDAMTDAIKHGTSFNIIHRDTFYKIDVFVPQDDLFQKEVFTRRMKHNLSNEIQDSLFFPSPEDIVLLKLKWYKAGGNVSEKQWTDILGVLKAQGNHLDREYMTKWSDYLGIKDLLAKSILDSGL